MNFIIPPSAICLIITICLLPFGWAIFPFPLVPIIGLIAGIMYKYKEEESKVWNRVGLIGNLIAIISYIGFFIFFLTHIS